MITLLYVFYHVFVIVIIYRAASLISCKSEQKYWRLALFPMILYALEEGMRWGRESDWAAYSGVYESIGNGQKQEFELLFYIFWRILSFTGVPYPFVITVCSFLLIFSLFYFSKDFKKDVWLIIPLLIVWISPKSIQFVRWFIGYSVFLIGYSMYLRKKSLTAFIISISSVLFHFGLILFVVYAFFVLYLNRPIVKPIYPIMISIVLILSFNIELLQNLSVISEVFLHSGTDRFSNYTNDPEHWLQANFETKTKLSYILNMLPLYIYLLVFYKCLDGKRNIAFYNIIVIGLILRSVSSGIEILDRYAICFDAFFVVASVAGFNYVRQRRHRGVFRYSLVLIYIISFVVQGYKFCKPREKEIQMHYYWESDLPSINSVANSYY